MLLIPLVIFIQIDILFVYLFILFSLPFCLANINESSSKCGIKGTVDHLKSCLAIDFNM